MRNPLWLCCCTFLLFQTSINAQIWNGADTLYGNEWIRFDQSYFKFQITEDGLFRINGQTLAAAGIPVADIQASQYQLFAEGRELPVFVSTAGTLGDGNFIEFYGRKNRSSFDRHLFAAPDDELFNPEFSMFTDSAAYFLTWAPPGTPTLRYQNIANDLTNLPPKENFGWAEAATVLFDTYTYLSHPVAGEALIESVFDKGEGWGGKSFQSREVIFPPRHIYPDAGLNARFEVRLFASNTEHHLLIKSNDQVVIDQSFNGYHLQTYTFEKPAGTLLADNEKVKYEGVTGSADKYALAFAKMRYPRLFKFENLPAFTFQLDGNGAAQYLEIEEFAGGTSPVIYDLTNNLRLEGVNQNNIYLCKLPAAQGTRQLFAANPQTGVRSITTLLPVTFTDYSQADYNFILLSHKNLFADANGNNWVQAYADYRASTEGGGYNPVVIDIQQVYDQFGYGIHRHPQSIRNLVAYAIHQWEDPQYLFVVGKGQEFNNVRTAQQLTTLQAFMLLPTFGYPGADNLLAATPQSALPRIPVGRLAAMNALDVKKYLEKVMGMENPVSNDENSRSWRKRVVHLGGGGAAAEQSQIRNNLNAMAAILETSAMGAEVHSFFKTSSEPVQQSQSEAMRNYIEQGIAIMNFFGHSSPYGFDLSIDDPANYDNEGKYPMVMSLGCYSGKTFVNYRSISEQFLIQEKKGAIAFMATTGFGLSNELNKIGRTLYSKLGNERYGQSLGKAFHDCLRQYDNPANWVGLRVLLQQFTLNGDPSTVITPLQGPDYKIDPQSLAFNPDRPNAQDDSLTISFELVNLGKYQADSVRLEILRQLPDASQIVAVDQKVLAPPYRRTYQFTMPVLGKPAVGFNYFYIQINGDAVAPEWPQPEASQNNNLLGADGSPGVRLYIFANGVEILEPAPYSIASQNNIVLSASTADALAPAQRYIFELDTTALFNSPAFLRFEVNQLGGLLQWSPAVDWRDSTAYYWRVSADSVAGQGYVWSTASFTYIENSPAGWRQGHYYQLNDDERENVDYPTANRTFAYRNDLLEYRIRNGLLTATNPTVDVNNDTYFFIGGSGTVNRGVVVYVFDSLTLAPWYNTAPGKFGSHYTTNYDHPIFPFWTRNATERQTLMNFLRDSIPARNYVIVMSLQRQLDGDDYDPELWAADSTTFGANLFQILEQQGAELIRQTTTVGPRPYFLMYRQNDPTFEVKEWLSEDGSTIQETFNVFRPWTQGAIRSTRIGPAQQWGQLTWHRNAMEPQDQEKLELYGVKPDNSAFLLAPSIAAADTTLGWIDAAAYPYLQLRYAHSDPLNRTPPQLQRWTVLYDELPDAALAPNLELAFQKDTIQQGEPLLLSLAVANVTQPDMDSLLVKYTIINSVNEEISRFIRYAELPGGDTLLLNFSADTRSLSGPNRLLIEVNPGPDQPERYDFNNVGLINFFVDRDRENPLLDVTFDGIHIMNGDLVSAKPFVLVSLKDENRYLSLTDTAVLQAFVQRPGGIDLEPLDYASGQLRFLPAPGAGPDNYAKLEWTPHFTESGIYTLFVQGRDATGNASGQLNYKVSFEVITEARISNVLNYPNPFSTSTQFVYTLTGEEPPAQFSIQIMTVSGRVVRTLTQAELGPLRIGAHRTDFTWDGTDDYGDRLANGVYLYRILAKDRNGKEYGHQAGAADAYFKGGMGKLVILR